MTEDVDDHPLLFMVDHVREAGMVQIQTEIAAALPEVSTALDRHGDSWWLHVAWGRRWARLYWHPEHGFDVFTDTFTESGLGPTATPAEAIARLVEWVRGRLP